MTTENECTFINPAAEGLDGILDLSSGKYRSNWQAHPEHIHENVVEMCFCARGALVYACGGNEFTILPDNLFLVQPGTPHHLITAHKNMRIHWLSLSYPRRNKSILGLSVEETRVVVRKLKAVPTSVFEVDPAMRKLFDALFGTVKNQPAGPFRRLTLRTLVIRILLMAIECSTNRPSLGSLSKIDRIAKMMEKRPAHAYSLGELAAHAKLSESRFIALFRKIKGLPPYTYLADCRLCAAKRFLSEGRDTVAKISRKLGFSSPQHLATAFRKTYGISPREYRASQQRSPSSGADIIHASVVPVAGSTSSRRKRSRPLNS